jgi:hypothetical protein
LTQRQVLFRLTRVVGMTVDGKMEGGIRRQQVKNIPFLSIAYFLNLKCKINVYRQRQFSALHRSVHGVLRSRVLR